MKKIILSLFIVVPLSLVTTHFLFNYFLEGIREFEIAHPMIKMEISDATQNFNYLKMLVSWLIYFFGLITLPLLLTNLIKWTKLTQKNWWKALLGFELFFLLYSYGFTPPDVLSTVLLFTISQPVVILNIIVLRKKLT